MGNSALRLGAACALVALAFAAPAARAQNAVAFQLDAGHTGSVAMPGFQPPLKLLWKKKIPGSGMSYPLIVDGIVYVTISHHALSDYEGVDFYALDAATGKTKWKRYIDNQIDFTADTWANATYDNGQVFVIDRYNVTTSYDAKSGRTKWSQLDGQYDQPGQASPPTAFGGTVYVSVGAVSERKGLLRWGSGSGGAITSPAIGDGGMYQSYACNASKYRLTDGLQLWQHGSSCGGGSTTAQFLDNLVFVRDPGSTPNVILDAETGAALGTFPKLGGNLPAALYDDGGSRFMIAPADDELNKFDVTDPAAVKGLWGASLNGEMASSPPLVVNGYAIEGTAAGGLYVLSPQGQIVWSTKLGNAAVAPINERGGPSPLPGLGAGGGIVVVPTQDDDKDQQFLFAFAPQRC